jgi:uncharacterized protein
MLITLISPAKKQLPPPAPSSLIPGQPRFMDESIQLMKILAGYSSEELMKLMKISPKLAALNVERNRQFSQTQTTENALPAAQAFLGDTYVGLESSSFGAEDWQFAQKQLIILSGLYGLLSPLDLIQPHRLEMGTRLTTPRGVGLYPFWGNLVTEEINQIGNPEQTNWVINLASQEYFKVVKKSTLKPQLLTPVFKDSREGKLKVIGIKAKKARGKMARFIIKNRLIKPEPLKKFAEDGYRYQPALSTPQEWIFVCNP